MTTYGRYLKEAGYFITYVLGITTPVSEVHMEGNGKVRYTTLEDGVRVSKVIHFNEGEDSE